MPSSATATNRQLATIIEKNNLLPSDVMKSLFQRAETLQEWLGQVAIEDRILTDAELANVLAKELGLPLVDPTTIPPDNNALNSLAADTCRSHYCVPIALRGRNLHLAVANPLDESFNTMLPTLARCDFTLQVAPMHAILKAIDKWYESAPAPQPSPYSDTPIPPNMAEVPAFVPPSVAPDPFALREDPDEVDLDILLTMMMENKASDLHLTVGSPPLMRVHGELQPMPFPVLKPMGVRNIIYPILTDVQITAFERHWELDFAYSVPGVSRFRVNVFKQRGSVGSILRGIPTEVPTLEKLGMPPVVHDMTKRPRGLVLVTGPTGSGKSTTLAAMIDEINRTRRMHIMTIEDPIEFLHKNKMSEVNQREIGADTESFTTALRHVLRQDPDVILIGEMRDLETIAAAVTAAETGHLVFATLHTTSAAQTIDRIIDVFPPYQQEQIRSQLSNTLEAILTQTLLPNLDGKGRSCAQEILIATPAVRNLIREGKVHQMTSIIQASAKYGMQTLDAALRDLVLARKVSLEEAIAKSSNPDDFKALLAMQ